MSQPALVTPESPAALIDRELSWLSFARRVLALAEDPEQPLLERVNFAGIMGTIYDEFAMKRIGGLFRKAQRGEGRRSAEEGLTPAEELGACRAELRAQQELVARLVEEQLRPALRDLGTPILDAGDLNQSQREFLARYFADSVEPILIPLAADAAHPFPFISNLGLNLAVLVTEPGRRNRRFVRIKVPANRPRWVPLPDHAGWVPLEQVIADNLSALFPPAAELACSFFRVTRGAKDDPWTDQVADEYADLSPGAIIGMVTAELTARKYAGAVRLEVSADMPENLRGWLATQLGADPADVIATPGLLSLGDLTGLPVDGHAGQRYPPHQPVTHPRLRNLDRADPSAVFEEIRRGDILVHLPYHSFDTSILQFIRSAAADPAVLAIKLTIYRTGRRSPIIQALKEAARHGKQVAVLVEITARFDEAPNISWGKELQEAGAHVAYGVERAKMNQLQDASMIRELYQASLAGVPIVLNVRGLCCLRAGVPGLSPTIQVYSTLGRFLEHSRIYRFQNGGAPEFFIGSADLMTRNLSRRMEVVAPVCDPAIKNELDTILCTYEQDNCSAWDMQPDGEYIRRHPAAGEARRSAQQMFIDLSAS